MQLWGLRSWRSEASRIELGSWLWLLAGMPGDGELGSSIHLLSALPPQGARLAADETVVESREAESC